METKLRRKIAIGYEETARVDEREEIHGQEFLWKKPRLP